MEKIVVKQFTKKERFLVFGFTNINQELLDYKNNTFYIIPSLITFIILSYYGIKEEWEHDLKHADTDIDDERTIIKRRDVHYHSTTFGTNIIDSGIHKWTFKLIRNDNRTNSRIIIGITKEGSYKQVIENNTLLSGRDDDCGFGYFCSKTSAFTLPSYNNYGININSFDVIEMIFNYDTKTLKFIMDGKNYGDCPERIDDGFSYKMGVTLYDNHTSVQLLSYEHDQ